MKKNEGFTLVEILAVIIILGIIALIIVPITGNVINESRNRAYEEQVERIINTSKNYILRENIKADYGIIKIQDLIDSGLFQEAPIDPRDNTEITSCIEYNWDTNTNQYMYKFDEQCIPFSLIISPDSNTGWLNSATDVVITTSEENFKYCITEGSNISCEPQTVENSSSKTINLTEPKTVCAYSNRESIEKTECVTYKIDTIAPTFKAHENEIVIMQGTSIDLKQLLDPTYGVSGEKEFACKIKDTDTIITNLDELDADVTSITCTATGNNNLSTPTTIEVSTYLNMLVNGDTFNSKIITLAGYETVTSIVFEEGISSEYETISDSNKADVSLENDNTIVAYVTGNTIKVQSNNEIYANTISESMFINMGNLVEIEFNSFNTSRVTDMSKMFLISSPYVPNLVSLDLSNWDTSNVTNMRHMFNGVSSLTSLGISNFDTSKVTNTEWMFSELSNLTSLDVSNWDTSSVTDMAGMFTDIHNVTILDVSNFNTSSVYDMGHMFHGASSLTTIDVSKWNTSSVTDMDWVFLDTTSLISLDISNWDTSSVTDIDGLFHGASNLTTLDISNFNISKVSTMRHMFYGTNKLTNLDLSNFNTSNVTDMEWVFAGSSSLTSLDISNWNNSKVITMEYMFYNTSNLTVLDISGMDFAIVTNFVNLFENASNLTTIYVKDQATKDLLESKRSEIELVSTANIIVK